MKGQPDLVQRYRAIAPAMGEILAELEAEILVGRTTGDLEHAAKDAIHRRGFESLFFGFRGYPAYITASLNQEVLNTPPGPRRLAEADLLKLQVGITRGGGHAYQSWTYAIGTCRKEDRPLIQACRKALDRAVSEARAGVRVGVLSRAIQETVEAAGYSVNRSYVGHGMGARHHEPPMIPCYDTRDGAMDEVLPAGQILSVQVIAHEGANGCRTAEDGWNVLTRDGRRAAMLSQMIVVGPQASEVLLPARDSFIATAR
jgi:methionyl aminopeptidase